MSPSSGGEIRVNRIREITCSQGHHVDISRAKPLSTIPCPRCGVEVRVPAQISHYLLVKLLARGSSGAVYQAYDEKLSRQVALKIIYQASEQDSDHVAEALREARTLATLNHPNVIHVYAFGEDMGQPFIVMELVDGGRVDKLVAGGQTLEESHALRIASGVARGLAAANRAGLTHGDVKPQNILLSREGEAKLIDFGLAVRLRGKAKDGNRVAGTPYYMAPEVVQGQPVDHRADMYSLGITLYQMLAGALPFTGDTPLQVMTSRLKQPAPEVLMIRPTLHRETGELVDRLLEIEPANRFADMDALADAIDAVRARVAKAGD